MRIDKATENDLDGLSVLFNDYRIFYQKRSDLNGARLFLGERIRNNESIIYVSRDKHDSITGFVQLYPVFSSTRMKRLWLLNDLYVVPESRGNGTAVALMDAAKEFSKQTESCGLVLETAKTNEIANRLYQRIGFKVDDDHNYYSWSS